MTDDAKPPKPAPSYTVGYGKPPVATRFKRGRSGNPAGRPKGSKNLSTLIQRELDRPATVTIDGEKRTLTKRQILVRQVVDKATRGDLRALITMLKLLAQDGEVSGAAAAAAAAGSATDMDKQAYDAIAEAYIASLLSKTEEDDG